MVIHESFMTRKPLEFTLIALFMILLLLLPVYFYTKKVTFDREPDGKMITETYNEVWFFFSPDSYLSANDKKIMFRINYDENWVQWRGNLLTCEDRGNSFRVSIDHRGIGLSDVVFTTVDSCEDIPIGASINYKVMLVNRLSYTFTGKDGEIIGWD